MIALSLSAAVSAASGSAAASEIIHGDKQLIPTRMHSRRAEVGPFRSPFLLSTAETLHACEYVCEGMGCPAGYFPNAWDCKCHCSPGEKPNTLYFYDHIPKTGGKLFAEDARTLGGLTACGEMDLKDSTIEDELQLEDAIAAWKIRDDDCNLIASEGHLNANLGRLNDTIKKEDIKTLVLLRQPREHVLSMYHHCQHPQGQGKLKFNYLNISHSDFLKLALEGDHHRLSKYCGYYPANMMTRLLAVDITGEWMLPEAKGTVDNAAFVGLFEHYELSLCLLGRQVQGKLPEGCGCEKAATLGAPPLRDENRTKFTHFEAHAIAHPLDDVDTQRMDDLTAMDRELYQYAAARFQTDVIDHGLGCWLKR